MSERDVLQLPEYDGLTNQESLDRLLEVIVLRTDSTRYSYQGIVLKFGENGEEIAATILMLLDQSVADQSLSAEERSLLDAELFSFRIGSVDGKTGGLDFSNANRQAKLSTWIGLLAIAGNAPAAAALTAVRELGVTHGPRWMSYGPAITVEPTLESVAAARDKIKAVMLSQDITAAVNGEQTLAQIKALVETAIGGW